MNHIAYFKYILMMNKKINGYKLTASKPSSYDTLLNKLKVLKLMISFYKFLFPQRLKHQVYDQHDIHRQSFLSCSKKKNELML